MISRRDLLLGAPALVLGSGMFRPAWSAPVRKLIEPERMRFVPMPSIEVGDILTIQRAVEQELYRVTGIHEGALDVVPVSV